MSKEHVQKMVELGFEESDAEEWISGDAGRDDSRMDAHELSDEIISLTDSIDDEKELWAIWKTINSAMSYLNSKHTMVQIKNKRSD